MTARSVKRMLALAVFAAGLLVPTPVMAAQTATATSITVSPTSGTSNTDFKLTAKVLPVPDSGNVRITAWSAQTGGYITWDHTFVLNENGVAVVNYVQIDAGRSWWQAEYLGNSGYAPSTSARKSVDVTGTPVTMTDAQITWNDWTIGGIATVEQAGYNSGSLEIVVDGETLASCVPSGDRVGCSIPNRTRRGPHSVFLRFVPSDGRYANGITPTESVYTGQPLPPDSGILINGDAFSTRSLPVEVNVGTNGQNVDLIKLSNSADGLAAANEIPYAALIPWEIAPGSDGNRTVFALLHTAAGGWSTEALSDTIFYDTTPPTGSFVINNDDAGIGSAWGDRGIDSDQYLTGSVTDNSFTEAGATVTSYAASTDCRRYVYGSMGSDPGQFEATVSIFGDSWGSGVSNEGGLKTFCVMWRDAAGNWSDPVTDSIMFNWNLAVGTLFVNGAKAGGPGVPLYVSATSVSLKIQVDEVPPEGIKSIKVYGDNGNPDENMGPNLPKDWPQDGSTSMTIPWSLTNTYYGYTSRDGYRNIAVRFVTNPTDDFPRGRVQWIGGAVLLDRAMPTSDVPAPAVAQDGTIIEAPGGDGFGVTAQSTVTTIPTNIQWKASDASGIKAYDLDRLLQGTWTDVALAKPTDTSVRQSVATGTSNQFRLKTTDKAGNTTAWKNGPAFSTTIIQEYASNLVYTSAWKTDNRSDALGGSIRTAKALGASVKLTFTGRGIALVAPRGLTGLIGTAKVYIDGKLIKDAFFTASTLQPRRVVFTTSWKAKGTHTIKVVKKYASYAMPIDAFIVLN